LNFAVQHAAFEAGGQDIAQHDESFLIGAWGNSIETRIGKRNPDIFALGAVDLVAQYPATADAMRVHAATAIVAFSA
jgi:hypothetical protein